jgi:hypothetical protein
MTWRQIELLQVASDMHDGWTAGVSMACGHTIVHSLVPTCMPLLFFLMLYTERKHWFGNKAIALSKLYTLKSLVKL